MDNNQNVTNNVNEEKNTIAIVGFILSFFFCLAGLICSIIGITKAKNANGKNKGLAIAGIIISALGILIKVITIIVCWALFASILGIFEDEISGEDGSLSNQLMCSFASDCVLGEDGYYTCEIEANNEEKKIKCSADIIKDYQVEGYDDDETYDYYYFEKEDSYLDNATGNQLTGTFYEKLYILNNNTYYMIHNNLSTNSIEYDYGTYTKDGNILNLTNTKTLTTEKECYYDDGPYYYTFDLTTLKYSDANGYVDITFKSSTSFEDIDDIIPNYTNRCASL